MNLGKVKDIWVLFTQKPEIFFIVVASFFGLLFLVLLPPYQSPDEQAHFFRAYQISNFDVVLEKGPYGYGARVPEGLVKTVEAVQLPPTIKENSPPPYHLSKTIDALKYSKETKDTFVNIVPTAYYSPVSYLPQVIGIWIGKILSLPPLLYLYLGRIMNLLVWIVAAAIAIRLMPYRKWALVAVASLPMVLAQAASFSADVMALTTLLVLTSYIFYLRQKAEKLSIKQWLLIGGLIVLMGLSKQMMFVFIPLVFLLPRTHKKLQKDLLIKAGVTIGGLVIAFAWLLFIRSFHIPPGMNPQNYDLQLQYVIHQPLTYLHTIYQTYFEYGSDSIVKSFAGNFGWLDTPLGGSVMIFVYIGLAFALFVTSKNNERASISLWNKFLLGGIITAYILGVTTAIYLTFSPPYHEIVFGLQGRYFLPVVLILVPILGLSWLQCKKSYYIRTVAGFTLISLIASALTIGARFY